MRRWGQIAEPQTDDWYHDVAKSVYLPDTYLTAAKLLVDEGFADKSDFPWDTSGYRESVIDRQSQKGEAIPFALRLAVNRMTNSHSQRLNVTVH